MEFCVMCDCANNLYFETGPLQCLRDVPQHLNVFSTLIAIDLMLIDGHECTVFIILAFCEAFLKNVQKIKMQHSLHFKSCLAIKISSLLLGTATNNKPVQSILKTCMCSTQLVLLYRQL